MRVKHVLEKTDTFILWIIEQRLPNLTDSFPVRNHKQRPQAVGFDAAVGALWAQEVCTVWLCTPPVFIQNHFTISFLLPWRVKLTTWAHWSAELKMSDEGWHVLLQQWLSCFLFSCVSGSAVQISSSRTQRHRNKLSVWCGQQHTLQHSQQVDRDTHHCYISVLHPLSQNMLCFFL